MSDRDLAPTPGWRERLAALAGLVEDGSGAIIVPLGATYGEDRDLSAFVADLRAALGASSPQQEGGGSPDIAHHRAVSAHARVADFGPDDEDDEPPAPPPAGAQVLTRYRAIRDIGACHRGDCNASGGESPTQCFSARYPGSP